MTAGATQRESRWGVPAKAGRRIKAGSREGKLVCLLSQTTKTDSTIDINDHGHPLVAVDLPLQQQPSLYALFL
jgi:hypothetical protein